jgi:hypothetical protein
MVINYTNINTTKDHLTPTESLNSDGHQTVQHDGLEQTVQQRNMVA